jgi:hypothetical protein
MRTKGRSGGVHLRLGDCRAPFGGSYSRLMTRVIMVSYLWVETGSVFRPTGISHLAKLLYAG